MSESKDVVVKSIEEVKEIVDLFYQQKEKEALDQFTIGLSNMMTAIDALFTYRTEHDDFEFKTSYDMEDDLINHIRFKEALNHLNNMSYEKRISFILKHYYGYSIEEISEILKVSQGTTKSRIHNTMKKLRELLS